MSKTSKSGQEIAVLVAEQLRGAAFQNLHGITPDNVAQFLAEPFQALVDPDDLETSPRLMWIVLRERPSEDDGYAVVFDQEHGSWGIAEPLADGNYILVVSAETLSAALEAM